MTMKTVLKNNLSIQMTKKIAKYDNENCFKEQFKHSDDQNQYMIFKVLNNLLVIKSKFEVAYLQHFFF